MEPTKSYHIIADGYKTIRIKSYNPNTPKISSTEKEFLKKFIKEQSEKSKSVGGSFYDGSLVGALIDSIKLKDKEISFDTQQIKYSQHTGLYRNSHSSKIQAVYVNSLVITDDNMLVFGKTQATEHDWMNRLGIPAGGLQESPDGSPSLGSTIYAELAEEIGIAPEHHIKKGGIIPGWISGASKREKNYHLTVSFITSLKLSQKEMTSWFKQWKNSVENNIKSIKVEFKDLEFIPNDYNHLKKFIVEQNKMGNKSVILPKTLDVLEEWVTTYKCDIKNLGKNKGLYLPQPKLKNGTS
ncbi:hypothetical protein CL617_03685 [archaeon]|nr:hypothetical protein [archaeon]|tara:strand:+ start:8439 stop:9329 length:891 start_codon:yes stop_codon:yes gene_type:complete